MLFQSAWECAGMALVDALNSAFFQDALTVAALIYCANLGYRVYRRMLT